MLTPDQFKNVPCPTYPEIRLAITTPGNVARKINKLDPEAIHIATEGPLGVLVRRYCLKNNLPFTTAYHTRFPEYVAARVPVPVSWGYAVIRWFHGPSRGVMVSTQSIEDDLRSHGLDQIKRLSRGVMTDIFHPRDKSFLNLPRPINIYVGRVAVEKNLEAFLSLEIEGSKLIVGDGPAKAELEKKYPDVHFVGAKKGEDLARHYAAADIFVFPSRTDTFGLVLLEALASGLPVAAYPVPGPKDVINGAKVGCLHEDLKIAVKEARKVNPQDCRDYAMTFSWSAVADQFLDHLVLVK